MPLSNEQVLDRMKDYAAEFLTLLRAGADRRTLLNGDEKRHGLNHLNELFQMLPDNSASEFKVRE